MSTDESELSVGFIGDIAVKTDGVFLIQTSSEARVRTSIAFLARAHGWYEVREEVVAPGWGRIDLVLRATPGATPYLVELKMDLSWPASIRKAFQQVDGYARWWTTEHNEEAIPILSSCKANVSQVDRVAIAYPHVTYCAITRLIGEISGGFGGARVRRDLAVERIAEAERIAAFHRAALVAIDKQIEWEGGFKTFLHTLGGGDVEVDF